MKYLSGKSFSSPANSKAYVEGWERTFGEDNVEYAITDPDEIQARMRMWTRWCEACQARFTEPHDRHVVVQDDAPRCIQCNSANIGPLWCDADRKSDSARLQEFIAIMPNGQRCRDCEYTWDPTVSDLNY